MSLKLKIDNDELAEEFFSDVRIIGITGPKKAYQFCWLLNHQLRFDFRINNEIEISLARKNRNYFFNIYQYIKPGNSVTYLLYTNQFDGEYLLPEFKHFDFFWMFKGNDILEDDVLTIVRNLRELKGIQFVTELQIEQIKNKSHLIF